MNFNLVEKTGKFGKSSSEKVSSNLILPLHPLSKH